MVAGVAAPDWCGSVLLLPKPRDQVPLGFSALRRPRERRPQIQIAMPAMRAMAAAPMAIPAIAPGERPEWLPVEAAALTVDDVAGSVGAAVTVAGRVALVVAYSSPYSSSYSSWSSSAGSGPSVGHLSPTIHQQLTWRSTLSRQRRTGLEHILSLPCHLSVSI